MRVDGQDRDALHRVRGVSATDPSYEARTAAMSSLASKVVLHVETGIVSRVRRIFPDGCWVIGGQYVEPEAVELYLLAVEGNTGSKRDRITAPVILFERGDGLLYSPDAFVVFSEEAAELFANVARTLGNVVVGAGLVAKDAGIEPAIAIRLVVAALRQQAHALEQSYRAGAPGGG